jgi:hypothetical protein
MSTPFFWLLPGDSSTEYLVTDSLRAPWRLTRRELNYAGFS